MEARSAFHIRAVLDRRPAGGAPIRAVAVDEAGQRLYLGMEDGLLEEHSLATAGGGGGGASLTARKHVSKRVRQAQCSPDATAVRSS